MMRKIARRWTLLAAALLLLLQVAACGRTGESDGDRVFVSQMSLEEIVTYIYDRAKADGGFTATEGLVNTEITADRCAYYFGAEIPFEEALASEYEMQPPAYSLCVARIGEDEDIEAVKETVRQNANPMKWVCTGVSAVEVEHVEDVVLLVMAGDEEAKSLAEAFLSLQ